MNVLRCAVAVSLVWSASIAVAFADQALLRRGLVAFAREDYATSARLFIPLAQAGDPAAQARLGFQFETGRGVPMNVTEAAFWYRRAAEQGDSAAQLSLGLLYDRGQGVPRNIVEAAKWLNLAAAGAPRGHREARARLRDAVTTKMTRGEVALSRARALDWIPSAERF